MSLAVHVPSERDLRRRRLRLGMVRRVAPAVGILGCAAVRALAGNHRRGAAERGGFFLPVEWVTAGCGGLPQRSVPTPEIATILADWVSCEGRVYNTIDYHLGAGDWSAIVRSTDGDPVREEARQLQQEGLVYRRTECYDHLIRTMTAGTPQRRQGRTLLTRDEVDGYFERFVRLFRAIETHGMLCHDALAAAGLRFNQDRALGVAVDADGRIHRLQGGNHRWAIAQVLGLPEVPVEFRLHHLHSANPMAELGG